MSLNSKGTEQDSNNIKFEKNICNEFDNTTIDVIQKSKQIMYKFEYTPFQKIFNPIYKFWASFRLDLKKRFYSTNNFVIIFIFICSHFLIKEILQGRLAHAIYNLSAEDIIKLKMDTISGWYIGFIFPFIIGLIINYDLFTIEYSQKTIIYLITAPISKSSIILARIFASLIVFDIEFFFYLMFTFLYHQVPFSYGLIINFLIFNNLILIFFMVFQTFFSFLTRNALLPSLILLGTIFLFTFIDSKYTDSHPGDHKYAIDIRIINISKYYNQNSIIWLHLYPKEMWIQLYPLILITGLSFIGCIILLKYRESKM